MDIKLSTGEEIIKQWDYAKTKKRAGRTKYELLLTNKRLISLAESKIQTSRDDFLLKNINGVSATTAQNKTLKIIGIILCCTVIGAIIGIPMVKKGNEKKLSLTIYGEFAETNVINAGAASIIGGLLSLFKRKKKTKVKIDGKQAEDIVANIGALIMQ